VKRRRAGYGGTAGQEALVLMEPTQYQPGQAVPVSDDHREGKWEITDFSGAVRRERKTQLIERCEALLAAVKQVRERANRAHAKDIEVGDPVFEFLLG